MIQPMSLALFNRISHEDFQNGAVRDAIRAALKDRERLLEEVEKLAKFKAYVHRRLDEAGVPVDPESRHKADGCRIGAAM